MLLMLLQLKRQAVVSERLLHRHGLRLQGAHAPRHALLLEAKHQKPHRHAARAERLGDLIRPAARHAPAQHPHGHPERHVQEQLLDIGGQSLLDRQLLGRAQHPPPTDRLEPHRALAPKLQLDHFHRSHQGVLYDRRRQLELKQPVRPAGSFEFESLERGGPGHGRSLERGRPGRAGERYGHDVDAGREQSGNVGHSEAHERPPAAALPTRQELQRVQLQHAEYE